MKRIEDKVRAILINYPNTRNSDYLLMSKYLQVYRPDLADMPMRVFFENSNILNAPKYESVTRCRRKIQQHCKEFRAVEEVELMRYEKEQEYKQYAKE